MALGFGAGPACTSAYKKSLGGDTDKVFNRVYFTDFNTAWQSTLDALKSVRLDIANPQGGYIQTRWTENTTEKNFTESFAGAATFLKAQYRLKITVASGTWGGNPSVKVSILREQLVQRDLLEGWKAVETDSVEESTLLYRIGRLVWMKTRIAQQERESTRRALEREGTP